MDSKKGVAILIIVVLAIAAAWFLLFSGEGGNEEKEVRKAFKAFSTARSVGNKDMAALYISKRFTDAGLVYKTAIEEFGRKRPGYTAEVNNINLREKQADISYVRKELKDGKPAHTPITKEIWVKEADGKWRLYRLAAADRMRVMKERNERRVAEARILEDKLAEGIKADEVEKIKFYTADNKRDPFESLIAELTTEGIGAKVMKEKRCDPSRARQFLESFDLLSIKLVGVLFGQGTFALVETPNGNGYTVRRGMYMGRNCGKIVKITSERVIVSESFLTSREGFKKRIMELKLRQEES
ncbi:MAG: pilus assembly protein PilP [Nitrospinota bacterium]